MNKIVFLLLFFFSLFVKSQELNEQITIVENGLTKPSAIFETDEMITYNLLHQLEKYKIYGVSVAVINEGKIEWTKSYGFADNKKTTPVTKNTLFQSASIGKIITAIVALKLVQEQKLNLDENINKKLKRWKLAENSITRNYPVTLRHLLSHTAGLTDDYGFLGYKPNAKIPSLLQILEQKSPSKSRKTLKIKTRPGTVERYSGAGYLIAQLLLEDVSGLSFENLVQKYIFDPLKMMNSTYNYQPDKNLKKAIAFGHNAKGKPLKKKKYHIYPEKAAAGFWTTAEDLAKLIIGIQNNKILNKSIRSQMMTSQINNKGIGVNLKGVSEPKMFWHAGQNLGFTGLLFGSIHKDFGAVILLNSDGGEKLMQEFITSVANTYNWPVMQSYKSLKITEQEKNYLPGNYVNDDKTKSLSILIHKEKLVVIPKDSKQKVQLFKIGENHFTFKNAQDYYKLQFEYKNSKIIKLNYTESIGKTTQLQKI